MIGAAAIAGFVIVLGVLLLPRISGAEAWRAVATPLASIIGSGFLVSVPILRDQMGGWGIYAMAGLLALAWLIGAAVRENIAHVEPLLEPDGHGNHARGAILRLERASEAVLAVAYFVSVAYYLALFASFALKPFGLDRWLEVNLLVSALLAGIGVTGFLWGFRAVERVEVYAVSVKLAMIGGLVAALAVYGIGALVDGGPVRTVAGRFELASMPVLLGLLITVQGFETSRYLGASYPAGLRIRTMKLAQGLSAAIYIAFFLCMIPVMGIAPDGHGVAGIVDMLGPVSMVLPALVITGALASQSSAAIADTLGAGGLVRDLSGRRVELNRAYPLIAIVAAIIIWSTDIYSLIALASRCFALYYALQCAVAAASAWRRGRRDLSAGFALLAVVCAAVVVFGAEIDGE